MKEYIPREQGALGILVRGLGITVCVCIALALIPAWLSVFGDPLAVKWMLVPLSAAILFFAWSAYYLLGDALDIHDAITRRRRALANEAEERARRERYRAGKMKVDAQRAGWEFAGLKKAARETLSVNLGPPQTAFIKDRRNEKQEADLEIGLDWAWKILELAYEHGWTEEALVKPGLVPEEWYRWALHGEDGVLCRLGLVLGRGPGQVGRLAYPTEKEKALAVLYREWREWNPADMSTRNGAVNKLPRGLPDRARPSARSRT